MVEFYYTEDLSHFINESEAIISIIKAWKDNGVPDGFIRNNVRFAFTSKNGKVFLINEEGQLATIQYNALKLWHVLPHSGEEGFLSDLLEGFKPGDLNEEDEEYVRNCPDFDELLGNVD